MEVSRPVYNTSNVRVTEILPLYEWLVELLSECDGVCLDSPEDVRTAALYLVEAFENVELRRNKELE